MRSSFAKQLTLGVSSNGIALLQTSGWLRCRTRLVAEVTMSADEAASPHQLSAALGTLIAEHNCKNLVTTIVLADELVRMFSVSPPPNATRMPDCRSAAAVRFHALYGESIQDWQLQADWRTDKPFLACALPAALHAALQQVAIEHKLTLMHIVPHFIAAWNRWHQHIKSGTWMAVALEDRLTLGVADQHGLAMIRATRIPADGWQDPHWLPTHLQREALRANLTEPQQLLVCGQVPGQWEKQAFGALTCLRLDRPCLAHIGTPASGSAILASSGVHA